MKKKKTPVKSSLLDTIIQALDDLKAQQITVLDVSALTDVTDKLVIASGSSNRQVRALAEHVAVECKKQGFVPLGMEGMDGGEWVLVDLVDAVVHVMLPEARVFYDLENLWQAPEPAPAKTSSPAATITKTQTSTRTPKTKATPAKKIAVSKPAAVKKVAAPKKTTAARKPAATAAAIAPSPKARATKATVAASVKNGKTPSTAAPKTATKKTTSGKTPTRPSPAR